MSVERATEHLRQRACPACGASGVTLPAFTSRRRRPVTCTNCGQRLEIVYPGPAYYSLAFVTGSMLEASLLAVLILGLFRQWEWIAAIVVANLVANYVASTFLTARATVRVADLDKLSRKALFGRWYPK